MRQTNRKNIGCWWRPVG